MKITNKNEYQRNWYKNHPEAYEKHKVKSRENYRRKAAAKKIKDE